MVSIKPAINHRLICTKHNAVTIVTNRKSAMKPVQASKPNNKIITDKLI